MSCLLRFQVLEQETDLQEFGKANPIMVYVTSMSIQKCISLSTRDLITRGQSVTYRHRSIYAGIKNFDP